MLDVVWEAAARVAPIASAMAVSRISRVIGLVVTSARSLITVMLLGNPIACLVRGLLDMAILPKEAGDGWYASF